VDESGSFLVFHKQNLRLSCGGLVRRAEERKSGGLYAAGRPSPFPTGGISTDKQAKKSVQTSQKMVCTFL
jgi:hypothetical protein